MFPVFEWSDFGSPLYLLFYHPNSIFRNWERPKTCWTQRHKHFNLERSVYTATSNWRSWKRNCHLQFRRPKLRLGHWTGWSCSWRVRFKRKFNVTAQHYRNHIASKESKRCDITIENARGNVRWQASIKVASAHCQGGCGAGSYGRFQVAKQKVRRHSLMT